MSVTAASPTSRSGGGSFLWKRQLDTYPETGPRYMYLAITVLSTVMLYYELYVGGSVSTLYLVKLHMTFSFLVYTVAFGALIGAFGSLFAGVTDRLGRANIVVIGLIATAIFVAFIIPTATSKWPFTIETWVVAAVEGMCLVATPALIRDFSPQVGRATAMGFWTSGPVLGSLIVFLVASHTIGSHPSPAFWVHEFKICGIAGLVVAAIALLGLRELSPGLRDQLMVTMRDRALIEARAKGIDIEASLRNPFRQLLKADIIISSLGISIFLVIYYTAVLAGLIYFTTVFGFSVKDGDALGNWNWGFNVIAVVLIGFVSDYFKVRKPFMVIGGAAAAVMTVIYLWMTYHGSTVGYYHVAVVVAALAFCLGVAYVPWMASFTENVEARNPALTATGLAIWGWIIRVVVFVSYLILPSVINTVTPLVTYGGTVAADAAGAPRYHTPPVYPALAWAGTPTGKATVAAYEQYKTDFTFAAAHPTVVASAEALAPELGAIAAHQSVFAALLTSPTPANIAAAEAAVGPTMFGNIVAHSTAIKALIPYQAQLTALAAVPSSDISLVQSNASNLTALGAVPSSVTSYVSAHAAAVVKAAGKTAGQWRDWYWICFVCMIIFLATVPLMRGRWTRKKAIEDEQAHEAMVQAEMAKLGITA
jgi:ACS family D-galactonate transporter-like MFS transporter